MTDYTPVACGFHSELELAIMHGQQLKISWQEVDKLQNKANTETIKPIDLIVRDHKEYLVIEDQSGQRNLRLDYIIDVLARDE
jgi:transcriptional antiterminator Rof (Rho-off)